MDTQGGVTIGDGGKGRPRRSRRDGDLENRQRWKTWLKERNSDLL